MYTYDYGDDWRIRLGFLGRAEDDAGRPVLLEYVGIPPREDSGGIWRYNDSDHPAVPGWDPLAEFNEALEHWMPSSRMDFTPPVIVPDIVVSNLPVALGLCGEHDMYIEPGTGKIFAGDECGYYPV